MKIKSVIANTAVVPMGATLHYPTNSMENREYTLVKITNSDGVEGFGFCCGGTKAGHLSTIAVRDLLRDQVVGRESHEVEAIWQAMFACSVLQGRRGSVMRAISAIDIALWDLRAKEFGVPLSHLLGTNKKESLPSYASGGVYMDGKGAGELADELAEYVDLGFNAVKMKVGGAPLKEDIARLTAARKAIGDDVTLLLDANNAWSNAPAAIRAIRHFEEYNPGWIEEPVMPDEIRASADVAAAINIPVATGEIEATRWGFQELIHHRAASILQPDAAVCGGISEWLKIAALASAHGIQVAPHWFPEIHVHLVAAVANGMYVECVPHTKVASFALILKNPIEVRKGCAVLPGGPGIGLELDEKSIKQYSVDGWN
jgi:L-alanine-DL-glutamate epimerase-like enolase superfamily enzyme